MKYRIEIETVRVDVWGTKFSALDMGDVAAQWFTEVLHTPCRLVGRNPNGIRLFTKPHPTDADHITQVSFFHYFITQSRLCLQTCFHCL